MTETGQTALHIAVHQGHSRVVERLVGFGSNLNIQDDDGDTALHIALSRDTADALSTETPQLNKVLLPFRFTRIPIQHSLVPWPLRRPGDETIIYIPQHSLFIRKLIPNSWEILRGSIYVTFTSWQTVKI